MKILKTLLTFLILNSVFVITSNAQIVYTDLNPDTVLSGSGIPSTVYYYIDLNSDGISDLSFHKTISAAPTQCGMGHINYSVSVSPATNSNVTGAGTTFSSSASWSAGGTLASHIYTYNSITGCHLTQSGWSNSNGGYEGVKFKIANQYYYGWVKISVGSYGSSIIIKEFAYNTIPNQPILAGETTCTTPTVNLTQSGSLSFCAGDSVTFTANGTGYQYQWKKNNINITGATAKTYTAKTAGVYKCKVTNSCGTKTSGTRTVTIPCRMTNENIVEALEHLSVYPNPASNSVTIKFPSDEAGEIQIVNLFGEVVFSEKINTEQAQIDVSRFSGGMYVVRWSSGENYETKTFSVIK